MTSLDILYLNLLEYIVDHGEEKETRNGNVLSIFEGQIVHEMSQGFPLLTTKKVLFKPIVAELLWFLRGDTNIKYLVENNCNIWNGDAFKNYISSTNEFRGKWPDTMEDFIKRIKEDDAFAKQWGELGPIYGKQWRSWETQTVDYPGKNFDREFIDQIQVLIHELKTNPNSRRLVVNAWNVSDLNHMIVPPCHYAFQCYVSNGNELSLMWTQRSVDVALGLPFNIASYGLLLEILAKEVDMIPKTLIGNLGDCHIYTNQLEGVNIQLKRLGKSTHPTLTFDKKEINEYRVADFTLENYKHDPFIYFPLSN